MRVLRRNRIWHFHVSVAIPSGPNIAGLDPESGDLTRLFHPRTDKWADHFMWVGPTLHGKSPIGRVTLQVLNINDPVRIEHRRLLVQAGVLPQ
jgi:hypothetical protein